VIYFIGCCGSLRTVACAGVGVVGEDRRPDSVEACVLVVLALTSGGAGKGPFLLESADRWWWLGACCCVWGSNSVRVAWRYDYMVL
jgi:hypothetical protein